ncbi:uncharacterized protein METZ01_LOCUS457874 [marine metagenome]|uniref:Uncharacterized protein n=1 Tax=marine metagenome TaxID=408172 RepID=A0A383ABQ0_9ZZZZ
MVMKGKPFIVTTSGVQEESDRNPQFSKDVAKALSRFFTKDWGNVEQEDWDSNDRDYKKLTTGGYGRILAAYNSTETHKYGNKKFWIIRDTEAITVLFPEEY